MFAVGLILWGSMTDLDRADDKQLKNLAYIAVFQVRSLATGPAAASRASDASPNPPRTSLPRAQLLGVLFLEVSRFLNDAVLLRKLRNNIEIVRGWRTPALPASPCPPRAALTPLPAARCTSGTWPSPAPRPARTRAPAAS